MRFNPDPTKDTAGFPILPLGDYRMKIGEFKTFKGETKSGDKKGQTNFGLAVMLTAVAGVVDTDGNETPQEHVGKKVYHRLYYHTPEAGGYNKGFILAGFGFSVNEEADFNEQLTNLKELNPDDPAVDWSFDIDSEEVGTAWRGMTNAELIVSLSVKKDNNNKDQQSIDGFRPVPTS